MGNPSPRSRTPFLLGLALAAAAAQAGETVRIQGILEDTAFPPPAPVRLEILETGDTQTVIPGAPFSASLPRDTLWNLCFSANGTALPGDSSHAAPSTGPASPDSAVPASSVSAPTASAPAASAASPSRREKCYEVRYPGGARKPGGDSVFTARIGQGAAVFVQTPEIPGPPPGSPAVRDTAGEEEDEGSQAVQTEEAVQLKKVLVRAQRAPKRSLGKSTVSAKLIKRLPGLAEADVIRSIQALPGVVASSDFSTKIYVRGGGSDQNLILLDKAVVYSPVHFFGLFSTFLVEGIDEVNFYKGGFPPEYGNRLSSVLDIKSRPGGKDTAESWFKGSSVKVSTFASQAHTEGRQGPVRWLGAFRRTYIDQVLKLLRDIGATDLELDYFFEDYQGNVQYDLGAGGKLMLSAYTGRDKLDFTPFTVDWGNTVIPLNYTASLGGDWTTRATASYSLFSQNFALARIFHFYNRILTYNYKQSFEYAGIESHRLTLGADLNFLETNFTNEQTIAKVTLQDVTDFWLNSLFLQDKWTLGQTELTSGVRLTHSSRLDEPGVEPRLSLKYRLPMGQSLDFHTGYYYQYVNSIQFADQENLNEFYYPAKKVTTRTVNPTTSLLFSAGYGVDKFKEEVDFTLEGYYKTLNHLLIFAPNELPDSIAFRTDLSLGDVFKEAQGYSYGFEVSARRPEGLIFGGASYSYGTSVIREDGSDEPYFPKWHQPHSFKADMALNWAGKDGFMDVGRHGHYFRSSTQVKYATGLPYTEFVGYQPGHLLNQNAGRSAGGPNPEFNQNINVIRGNRNAAFVPAYFRWDLKAIDAGREGKWNFSLTLLNLTDHRNIFFYTYDREKNPPERVEITQFPFFPLLVNYEYYF